MISQDQNGRNTDFLRQLFVTERSQWTLASFYECFLVSVAVAKSYSPCWEQHLQMPLALSPNAWRVCSVYLCEFLLPSRGARCWETAGDGVTRHRVCVCASVYVGGCMLQFCWCHKLPAWLLPLSAVCVWFFFCMRVTASSVIGVFPSLGFAYSRQTHPHLPPSEAHFLCEADTRFLCKRWQTV